MLVVSVFIVSTPDSYVQTCCAVMDRITLNNFSFTVSMVLGCAEKEHWSDIAGRKGSLLLLAGAQWVTGVDVSKSGKGACGYVTWKGTECKDMRQTN